MARTLRQRLDEEAKELILSLCQTDYARKHVSESWDKGEYDSTVKKYFRKIAWERIRYEKA